MYDSIVFGLILLCVLLAVSQAKLMYRVYKLEEQQDGFETKTIDAFQVTEDTLNHKKKTATRLPSDSGALKKIS
jgi:hypothetical protein